MAWKTQTAGTRHSCNEGYGPSFGRLASLGSCPRCDELRFGDKPRSWAKSNDSLRCEAVSSHFTSHRHLSGGCGPVCTFGEW